MKKLSLPLAIITIATMLLALTATTAQAAPLPAQVQSTAPVKVNNTVVCTANPLSAVQVCYDYVDPSYHDATYSCPEGSTQIDGDPQHCLVTSTGTIYTARPQVPATYKCDLGYTLNGQTCTKVTTPGHWVCNEGDSGPDANGLCTPPSTYSCTPESFSASRDYCPSSDSAYTSEDSSLPCKRKIWFRWKYAAKIHETFGPISVPYVKSSDPHKCHMDTGSGLDVPSWAQSEFNKLPQWKDSTETPGTPYQGSWVPPVTDTKDAVIDVAAHPGDCPAGWDIYSDTQCSQDVTSNETIDATVTAGEPYCKEGNLVDTENGKKCQVVIPCPPPDTTTICYNGQTLVVPTADLGKYPGYTAGVCPLPQKPVCPPGTFLAKDDGSGEGPVCKHPNYNFCDNLKEGTACDRHRDKFGAMLDAIQGWIFKIENTLGL